MRRLRISFHPLAAAGIFILCAVAPPSRAFGIVAAVTAHEAAHLFAGKLFGMRLRGVKILPLGISFEMSAPRSYTAQIAVAAAGPAINAVVCALIFTGIFPQSAGTEELFIFSIALAALNFLPIRTLDGGAILFGALAAMLDENRAERVLRITSFLALAAIWLVGIYIFFYSSENFALMAFSSFMFATAIMKTEKTENGS